MKKRFEDVVGRAASKVLRDCPNAMGIVVHGSVVRGTAKPYSDVDLHVVLRRGRKPSEYSYFDQGIYVGVGFDTVKELRVCERLQRLLLDPRTGCIILDIHDPSGTVRKLLRSQISLRPPHRILEETMWEVYHNIIEYAGKLRNAHQAKDAYLMRYAAHIIGV